ncbi:MAG: FGGY family carbohydrate kinase [Kiloniellales bacterium]
MEPIGRGASPRDRVVAIDQGTTATKAFALNRQGDFEAIAKLSHRQILPRSGWVEHDPEELLGNLQRCLKRSGPGLAVGLDNQGETVVAWDARTGRPVYNAIVWQDTRTKAMIEQLRSTGAEAETKARAGLPLDSYFSAAKLRWILDNVAEAKVLAREKRLRLGTSDAYFLDRLVGHYATDVSTAARTSLMNLDTLEWDATLCELFGIPGELLPEIRPTTGEFGEVAIEGGTAPITASVVDQTAALFGHRCFEPGRAKITFGTGAFALSVTGTARADVAESGLLPVVAWKLGNAPAIYAIDGGVYSAGSAVDWARSMGLFGGFEEIDSFQAPSAISRGLAFVPALSGLACPYWDREAAGLFIGMGLETTQWDLCQSVLEGIALRAAQVIAAMADLSGIGPEVSIDGGLSLNLYFRRFLADALDRRVVVPSTPEATSLGTAWLAMLGAGLVASLDELPSRDANAVIEKPQEPVTPGQHACFAEAVARARGWRRDLRPSL